MIYTKEFYPVKQTWPWQPSQPAVTDRPALCGSEQLVHPRCQAIRRASNKQKKSADRKVDNIHILKTTQQNKKEKKSCFFYNFIFPWFEQISQFDNEIMMIYSPNK